MAYCLLKCISLVLDADWPKSNCRLLRLLVGIGAVIWLIQSDFRATTVRLTHHLFDFSISESRLPEERPSRTGRTRGGQNRRRTGSQRFFHQGTRPPLLSGNCDVFQFYLCLFTPHFKTILRLGLVICVKPNYFLN